MTMTRSTMYQVRLGEEEKKETFAVFNALGVTPAQAVRMFFSQVRLTNSIPFPLEYTPNERTAKLLLADDSKKDYKSFKSLDDLFADLKD
jgi:addiction module RelB/DinJ family antitoxin